MFLWKTIRSHVRRRVYLFRGPRLLYLLTVLLLNEIHPDNLRIRLMTCFSSEFKCCTFNNCQIRSARGMIDLRFLIAWTACISTTVSHSIFSRVTSVCISTSLSVVLITLTGHVYFSGLTRQFYIFSRCRLFGTDYAFSFDWLLLL